MTLARTIAGIDVGQEAVDIAVCKEDAKMAMLSSGTTSKELDALAKKLKSRGVELVVLEATGGLELPVMAALHRAGLAFARINPRQVRDFAKAMNILAKTDRLDAKVLALYGLRIQPPATAMPNEKEQKLQALAVRKRQLVDMRQRERNRIHRTKDPEAIASIERVLDVVCADIEKIDDAIDALIATMPEIEAKRELADGISGIAANTATAIVTGLPELGRLSTRKLKKLVGVAPLNDDSAKRQGDRHIAGGRAPLRQALYMAAQTGYRHNPVLKNLYDRLRARGKCHKAAIIACIGKLIAILNAIFKSGKPFDIDYARR